jgi:hypothetical protein
MKLFEMDMKRQPYGAGLDWLIVSPSNARRELEAFIKGAKKELYLYDPCVSDPAMVRALDDRRKNGVDVKIIGHVTRRSATFDQAKLHQMRLHTRAILRDGTKGFLGSQSLRTVELDRRREVGMIFEDPAIIGSLRQTFLEDWKSAEQAKQEKIAKATPASKVAKRVAKAIVQDLPPVKAMIETAIQDVGAGTVEIILNAEELEDSVKDAVKHAVKAAVKDAVAMEPPAPLEANQKGDSR